MFTVQEQKLIEHNNLHFARVIAVHRLRAKGLTLRQIGTALDLSHERVRQLLQEEPISGN